MAFGWDRVTAREREVLRCLLDGFSVLQTAEHLGISRASVQRHTKNALAKLQGEEEARPVAMSAASPLGWASEDFVKGCRALSRLHKHHGIPWSLVAIAYGPEVNGPELGREVATFIRVSDRIGWAKDCLLLVLPSTGRAGAVHLAERIRRWWQGRTAVGMAAVEAAVSESPERTLERGQLAAQRALVEEEAWRRVGRG